MNSTFLHGITYHYPMILTHCLFPVNPLSSLLFIPPVHTTSAPELPPSHTRPLLRRFLRISPFGRELDRKPRILRPRQTVKLDVMLQHPIGIRINLLIRDPPDAVLRGCLRSTDAVELPEED